MPTNFVKSISPFYNKIFDNPYSYSLGKPSKSFVDALKIGMTPRVYEEPIQVEEDRSFLNRVVDVLSFANYAIAGGIKAGLDKDDGKTWYQGVWEGLKAANPFGKGNPEGEVTFSDVLGELGWKPESTAGKIAKGASGFVLDVVLDPTTYLTGGLGALITGTGKTSKTAKALESTIDTYTKINKSDEINRLLKMRGFGDGVVPDEVMNAVKKEASDNISRMTRIAQEARQVGKMTDDLAETVIRKRVAEGTIDLTESEIKRSAKELAERYNKVMGLRNTGQVTFGIGNLPFMPKKWQDKVWVLGSDEGMRKISDALKISSAYSGIRNFIYGSQIGKMFSNTSALKRLAESDPAKLWETLEFARRTRGLNMDKLQAEKLIFDRFKSLNLTPAESKEIIELLEDKTVWSKIEKRINLKQTEKGKHFYQTLKLNHDETVKQLEDLKVRREQILKMKESLSEGSEEAQRVLKDLERDYKQRLLSIDLTHMRGDERIAETVKLLQEDIDKLENVSKDALDFRNGVVKLYDEYLEQLRAKNEHFAKLETLQNYASVLREGGDVKELAKEVGELSYNEINKIIHKMRRTSPGIEKRFQLVEGLGKLLFDDHTAIRNISDDGLKHIVNMIKNGDSPSDIRNFLERNPGIFDSSKKDIYSFVAKEIGYSSWVEDGFNVPVGKLLGLSEDVARKVSSKELMHRLTYLIRNHGDKLDPKTKKEILRYLDRYFKREALLDELLPMTPKEFAKYKSTVVWQREVESINQMLEEDFLDSMRNEFIAEDEALEFQKTRPKTSSFQNTDGLRDFDPEPLSRGAKEDIMYEKQRYELLENWMKKNFETPALYIDLVRFNVFNYDTLMKRGEKEMKAFADYLDALEMEVRNIAKNYDRPYQRMTDNQKKFIISRALKNIRSSEARAKLVKKHKNDLIKKQESEFLAKIRASKIREIERTARIGDDIKFTANGQEYTGKIMGTYSKNDILYYKVRPDNYKETLGKSLVGVSVRNVRAVKKNNAYKSAEELLLDSDLAKSALSEREELVKQLKELESTQKARNEKYQKLREQTIKTFESRIKEQENVIKKFEEQKNELAKALMTEAPDDKIQQLTSKLEKQFQLLNNDDAFDTYMRMKLSEDEIKQAEASVADLGRIWLDERASSKKIADTVRALRSIFDEIGMKEVEIGKLSKEQFEKNLGRYVPHILTPDGEEYIRLTKQIMPPKGSVTFDLGFGTRYNPYSRTRQIEGTISEANRQFESLLKGKNLFSENIADIYLARAMKHNELIYDNKYMRTMLETFGKDIPADGTIEEGYRAVMNFGMMRKTVNEVAQMETSMEVSQMVSDFVSGNLNKFKAVAQSTGRNLDDIISEEVEKYVAQINDRYIGEIWERHYNDSIESLKLSKQVLAEDAVPMVELDKDQIDTIKKVWDDVYTRYRMHVNNQFMKSISRELGKEDTTLEMVDALKDLIRNIEMTNKRLTTSILTPEQQKNLTTFIDDSFNTLLRNLERQKNLPERVKQALERYEKMVNMDAPQIKQVNEVIVAKANQARKLQLAKDQNRFLQLYDKFLHFMKLNQTVVSPSFHARNKLSNMFQNWLAVGRDAVDMKMQRAAFTISRFQGDTTKVAEFLKNNTKGNDILRPMVIANPHPELVEALGMKNGVLRWEDAYLLARQYGVIDSGQFARDIGAGSASKGVFKKLHIKGKDGTKISLDPTDTANFFLYKKGTEVGSAIENTDRLVQFVSHLKQGKSPTEATELVNKFLFDYSDLTAFEQHVMKRIFPYYTWLRKNARLQVSQLIEQPEKYRMVAKVLNGVQHTTPEEERMEPMFISDWAEDWLQLPFDITVEGAQFDEYGNLIRGAKKEKALLNPALPFMDFNRIPDLSNPIQSLESLFTQTAPMIKIPTELAMNKNVFLDSKIFKDNEQSKAEQLGNYLSGQVAMGNIISGFAKDNPADVGLHALNQLTGIKVASYDYDTSKYMKLDELRREEENPSLKTRIDSWDEDLMELLRRFFSKGEGQ